MMKRLFLVLAATFALGGASQALAEEACPKIDVLSDATKITEFEGKRAPQFNAIMGDQALQCVVKDGVAHMRLKFKVTGALLAGAAAAPRKVSYFVVIIDGQQVLAKEVYSLALPFAKGRRNVSVDERINQVDIPIRSGASASDYQIMIGFQLTREQVEYNRKSTGY